MEGQNQEDVAVTKPKPVLSGTIYDVYWLGEHSLAFLAILRSYSSCL